MLDYLPVGVVIVKNNNHIKFANKELRLILPLEQTNNNTCNKNHEKELDIFDAIMEQNEPHTTLKSAITSVELNEEKSYRMELDKHIFEVKAKSLPICSGKTSRIAVVKDQTVYDSLVKEKTLEKYQKMLLSSISHEIRNPLNVIEGYLTFIREAKGDYENSCMKLRCAAHQIDFIVDGACDLLLCENKTIILQPRLFGVKECISELLEIVSPNYENKGLEVSLKLQPNFPHEISSDAKRYKLILFQLLNNAIKYTTRGSITIECNYDLETGLMTTAISDTGVGISPDVVSGLFKLYTNIEKANAYNPQGMGLGLALCDKLSKMLGGDISCTSVPGQGSTFSFSIKDYSARKNANEPEIHIPLHGLMGDEIQNVKLFYPSTVLDTNCSPSSRSDVGSTKSCECPQVLIVDDDPTNRMVLKYYLSAMNLTADEADNGLIGCEKVEARANSSCCTRYQLIVMDINMPVMDGTEATARLMEFFKTHKKTKAPILAVTAANMQTRDDVQNLLSVGFTDLRIFDLNEFS